MADVSIAACSSEALETVSTVRSSSNQWTKQPLAKALWVTAEATRQCLPRSPVETNSGCNVRFCDANLTAEIQTKPKIRNPTFAVDLLH
jgi:hypothetical protein